MKQWQGILAKIWWGVVGLTLVGLAWLSRPYISSAYHLHRGTQALVQENSPVAAAHLQKSLALEPENVTAYRRLARAQLQQNRPELARQTMQQALHLAPQNPLVLLETGDVYDQLGDRQQAVSYYEAGGKGDRKAKLAANYLQIAEQLWASGDEEAAVTVWRDKVRGTGYGDLYANWRLARYFAGQEEAAQFQEAVRYFSLESVAPPPDHRLDKYQIQSLIGVVKDEYWDRNTLLNVVSYRVWQFPDVATEQWLQTLLAKYPKDTDLRFYLGELYQRQGNWNEARTAYLEVLDLNPNYSQAYLQLGMLTEANCKTEFTKCRQEATKWYEQYYKLAPNDLLVLKKLVSLGRPEAENLNTKLEHKNDDKKVIAELFGIPTEEVSFGSNIITNNEFEIWDRGQPQGWQISNITGISRKSEFNKAVFIGGVDKLILWNNASIRSNGLWTQNISNKKPARYRYQQSMLSLQANTYYLVSVYYRTTGVPIEKARIRLVSKPSGLLKSASWLPPTDNDWKKFVMIIKNDEPKVINIRIFVDLFSTGNLWLDDMQVKPISFGLNPPKRNTSLPIISFY